MILTKQNRLLMKNTVELQMINLPADVEKYFKKNLLKKWNAEIFDKKFFNNIIIIPAVAEFENIKKLIHSLIHNDRHNFNETLILFVINNIISASEQIKIENKQAISFLKNIINKDSYDNFSKTIAASGLQIGLIDASSLGYEMDDKNGGVGLARKIGMDIALNYFNYQSPNKKIMICLDADCKVAQNYIDSIVNYFNNNNVKAAVVNYEHEISETNENTAAIICYELYLRYYLLGLTFAQSPFAFHTIGSTMVCDYQSYIKVGGMNKLEAAEDFYFLEKLSKITDVHTIKNTTVYPSSRPSFRVPFGTGQRVKRFLSMKQNEYLLYDPRSFVILRQWIELLNELDSDNFKNVIKQAEKIDRHLLEFLMLNKFELFWQKISKEISSDDQINRQKKYWFDAFKTLKLIHYLKDYAYPLVNMFDSIDALLELSGQSERIERNKSVLPDLQKQKEYLLLLRKLQNN